MREIKFRAWDCLKEKFVDVADHLGIDRDGVIYPAARTDHAQIVLMQFTGLKDKNGKEIYLSDLGKDRHGNIWRVDEMPNATGFGMTCVTDENENRTHSELYPQSMTLGWLVLHKLEVIGNIYKNPELRK